MMTMMMPVRRGELTVALGSADVDSAIQRHGGLDGAFNNAGIGQGGRALADIREENVDRLLAVQL